MAMPGGGAAAMPIPRGGPAPGGGPPASPPPLPWSMARMSAPAFPLPPAPGGGPPRCCSGGVPAAAAEETASFLRVSKKDASEASVAAA